MKKINILKNFNFYYKLLVFLISLLGLFLIIWPILWSFLTTFKEPLEAQRIPITWLPDNFLYFENYKIIFNDYPILRWLGNSLIITSLSLISTLFFCSLSGYAFAKLDFRFKEFLFISVLALIMIPPEITVVPLYLIFSKLGLTNTYAGIVGPNWLSVVGVFLMRQFMESIPQDYIDAARIDGASEFKIFYMIALPMTISGFITLAILKSILTWNDFLWPLVMASDSKMMTINVGIQSFSTAFYIDYTLINTGAIISIIPLIILYSILQKKVINSMTMSGLKG